MFYFEFGLNYETCNGLFVNYWFRFLDRY